jgi:thioredoxin 1
MSTESNLHELKNIEKFLELIQDEKQITVLDFHAAWCGPCKKLGSLLNDLIVKEKKYPSVTFLKADVDNKDLADLTKKFEVGPIPRILIFKGKEIKKDITGCKIDLIISCVDELIL